MGQGHQADVVNLDAVGFDDGATVVHHGRIQKRLVMFWIAFDPSTRQELAAAPRPIRKRERDGAEWSEGHLEVGDDRVGHILAVEGADEGGVVAGGAEGGAEGAQDREGLLGKVLIHVGVEADRVHQAAERLYPGVLHADAVLIAALEQQFEEAKGDSCKQQ